MPSRDPLAQSGEPRARGDNRFATPIGGWWNGGTSRLSNGGSAVALDFSAVAAWLSFGGMRRLPDGCRACGQPSENRTTADHGCRTVVAAAEVCLGASAIPENAAFQANPLLEGNGERHAFTYSSDVDNAGGRARERV
jgi:hypothetical protein